MRIAKTFGIVIAAILVGVLVTGLTVVVAARRSVEQAQQALDPFYATPSPMPPGKPGDVIPQRADVGSTRASKRERLSGPLSHRTS